MKFFASWKSPSLLANAPRTPMHFHGHFSSFSRSSEFLTDFFFSSFARLVFFISSNFVLAQEDPSFF